MKPPCCAVAVAQNGQPLESVFVAHLYKWQCESGRKRQKNNKA